MAIMNFIGRRFFKQKTSYFAYLRYIEHSSASHIRLLTYSWFAIHFL
jgi:hypothetical protein